jgi:hypothetical protein
MPQKGDEFHSFGLDDIISKKMWITSVDQATDNKQCPGGLMPMKKINDD